MRKVRKKELVQFNNIVRELMKKFNPVLEEKTDTREVYGINTKYGKATVTIELDMSYLFTVFTRFVDHNILTGGMNTKYNFHDGSGIDVATTNVIDYFEEFEPIKEIV